MAATLIVLTLNKHKDGIWIRRLLDRLHSSSAFPNNSVNIQIVILEDLLSTPFTSSSIFQHQACCIVNRVSDAASPIMFKACLAVLSAARVKGIPIFNGPSSYATCANKWCHHMLFQQAKLKSPQTSAFALWDSSSGDAQNDASIAIRLQKATTMLATDTPGSQAAQQSSAILIKPNAGGFGAGIQKLATNDVLANNDDNSDIAMSNDPFHSFQDQMALVQSYVPPHDGKLYRVWFLLGKVQCAVLRQSDSDEFMAGCAGNTCSVKSKPPSNMAWQIPENIRIELEEQLLPLLDDAHCGSVEFMHNAQGERLYFDLNLLSTLPVIESDEWKTDPWQDLADAIWEHSQK